MGASARTGTYAPAKEEERVLFPAPPATSSPPARLRRARPPALKVSANSENRCPAFPAGLDLSARSMTGSRSRSSTPADLFFARTAACTPSDILPPHSGSSHIADRLAQSSSSRSSSARTRPPLRPLFLAPLDQHHQAGTLPQLDASPALSPAVPHTSTAAAVPILPPIAPGQGARKRPVRNRFLSSFKSLSSLAHLYSRDQRDRPDTPDLPHGSTAMGSSQSSMAAPRAGKHNAQEETVVDVAEVLRDIRIREGQQQQEERYPQDTFSRSMLAKKCSQSVLALAVPESQTTDSAMRPAEIQAEADARESVLPPSTLPVRHDRALSQSPVPLTAPLHRPTASLGRGIVRKLSLRGMSNVARLKKSSTIPAPHETIDPAPPSSYSVPVTTGTEQIRPAKTGKRSIVADLDAFEALVEAAEARSGITARSSMSNASARTPRTSKLPSVLSSVMPVSVPGSPFGIGTHISPASISLQQRQQILPRPAHMRHRSSPSGGSIHSPSVKSARRAEREWRAKVAALSCTADGKRSPRLAAGLNATATAPTPAKRARGPVPPPRRATTTPARAAALASSAATPPIVTPPSHARPHLESPGETLILTPMSEGPAAAPFKVSMKSPAMSVKSFSTLGHHVRHLPSDIVPLGAGGGGDGSPRAGVRGRKASVPMSISSYYASAALDASQSRPERPDSIAVDGLLSVACPPCPAETEGLASREQPSTPVNEESEQRASPAETRDSPETFHSARMSPAPKTPPQAAPPPTEISTRTRNMNALAAAPSSATLTPLPPGAQPPRTPTRSATDPSSPVEFSPTTAQILAADYLDFSFDHLEFALSPLRSSSFAAHPYASASGGEGSTRSPTDGPVTPFSGPSSPPPRPALVPSSVSQQPVTVTERPHLPKRSTSLTKNDHSFLPPLKSSSESRHRPKRSFFRLGNSNSSRLHILGAAQSSSSPRRQEAPSASRSGKSAQAPMAAVLTERMLVFSRMGEDLTPGMQNGQRPPKSGMPVNDLEKWLRNTHISP